MTLKELAVNDDVQFNILLCVLAFFAALGIFWLAQKRRKMFGLAVRVLIMGLFISTLAFSPWRNSGGEYRAFSPLWNPPESYVIDLYVLGAWWVSIAVLFFLLNWALGPQRSSTLPTTAPPIGQKPAVEPKQTL